MSQDSRSTRSMNEQGFKVHKVSEWARIQGPRGQWMSQDSSVNEPGFKVHKSSEWAKIQGPQGQWMNQDSRSTRSMNEPGFTSEWARIQGPQGQWMSQDSSPVPYLGSHPTSSIIRTRVCKDSVQGSAWLKAAVKKSVCNKRSKHTQC